MRQGIGKARPPLADRPPRLAQVRQRLAVHLRAILSDDTRSICSFCGLPLREISKVALSPGLYLLRAWFTSLEAAVFWPSTDRMTSPDFKPALAAGRFAETSCTRATLAV